MPPEPTTVGAGHVLGPPSLRLPMPGVTGTGVPLHLDTRARPAAAPLPLSTPPPAPVSALPGRTARPRELVVLSGVAGPALLAATLAVLLPWRSDVAANAAPGIVGSAFGIGALVVSAGLLAAVAADLLEGRVRWLGLVAAPPLALLTLGSVGWIASLVSPLSASSHLALAGVPWPGPIVSGVGVWLFLAAQALCLAVGLVATRRWLRAGDDGPPERHPRRTPVLAVCASLAVLALVLSGVVLARTAPPVPAAPPVSAVGGTQ
ncbi:hypothetical protein WCD74_01555 [Actinomycetospora sp. OC33-EN08]|uniref:Uncharacterized protein n=1 Tax=Actinomycetospora aurantiaca TaxID=3129233 RepID=A0ABU8MGL1_9PSEU